MSPKIKAPEVLPYAKPRQARPTWVKLGLWGLPSRGYAWAFFWLCLATAIASPILAIFSEEPRWIAGLLLLASAYWYWAAIRSVDLHGSWFDTRVGD